MKWKTSLRGDVMRTLPIARSSPGTNASALLRKSASKTSPKLNPALLPALTSRRKLPSAFPKMLTLPSLLPKISSSSVHRLWWKTRSRIWTMAEKSVTVEHTLGVTWVHSDHILPVVQSTLKHRSALTTIPDIGLGTQLPHPAPKTLSSWSMYHGQCKMYGYNSLNKPLKLC